MRRTAVIHE